MQHCFEGTLIAQVSRAKDAEECHLPSGRARHHWLNRLWPNGTAVLTEFIFLQHGRRGLYGQQLKS